MPPKKQPKASVIKTILLIALIAGAGYFLYTAFLVENTISHTFISWEQAGSEVTTAKINQPVTLKLDIFSNIPFGYKGKVKVQIKKDVKWGKDIIVKTSTIDINIPIFNKSQQVSVTFTPNEKTRDETGEGLEDVLEYFYTLSIGDKPIYDPTERGSRNGLLVSNKAGGGTAPQVTGILFNDRPQIEVASGTAITTKVMMSGKGKGTLKLEIRKDNIGITDDSYVTRTKEVTLTGEEDTEITFPTWKAVSGGLTFREYFARAYWNGDLIYDPDDPAEREYVRVASGGSTDSSGDGQIALKSVTWNVNPNQYSTANLTFVITGTYSKAVTIDIRKDIQWGSGCVLNCKDEELSSVQKQISGTDEEVSTTVSFTAPSAGSWIFARVQGIYDSTSPDERKAQGTEVQVPSAGTSVPPPAGTPSAGITPVPVKASVTYNVVELKSPYGSGTKINVPSGSEIQVFATVTSSAPTSGTLSVEVRKDMTSWLGKEDTTHTVLSKQATTLQAGTNTVYVGSFIASDVTGVNYFRQYFFKPSWNGLLLNDPTDSSTRESVSTYKTTIPAKTPLPTPTAAPSLTPVSTTIIGATATATATPPPTPSVTTSPTSKIGLLYINKIMFGNPPQNVYEATEYSPVSVYVQVRIISDDPYTKLPIDIDEPIKVEIRKDYSILPDETIKTLEKQVTLQNLKMGDTIDIDMGYFTPDTSTGGFLRQYFGRGYLWSKTLSQYVLGYNPTDPSTRPHVLVI